jgi:ABC-2 type transport system ATP-binding protein
MVVRGEPEQIRRRLEKLGGVHRVDVSQLMDGECRVTVASGKRDLREELARAVVSARLGLRELRSQSLSLEDVFLRLTTEEPTE